MRKFIPLVVLFFIATFSIGQTVNFMDCNGRIDVEFSIDNVNSPDPTGRNVFINAMATQEIRYNSTLMRWELKVVGMGGTVISYSNANYFPNPPSSSAVVWTDAQGPCGDEIIITGNGTQNQFCPANSMLSITCRNLSLILDSMDAVIIIAPTDVLIDTTATCGIDTIILSQTSFSSADLGENMILVTITDLGNNTSTCVANVSVALPLPVPALSDWKLIILSLSIVIIGVVFFYKSAFAQSNL